MSDTTASSAGNLPQPLSHHVIEEHKKYFTFFNLALALIAITAVELVVVYVPLPFWIVISSLIILSAVKFAGVVWWFMHLRWDRIFLTLLFILGLAMAFGTVIALLLLFPTAPGGVPA